MKAGFYGLIALVFLATLIFGFIIYIQAEKLEKATRFLPVKDEENKSPHEETTT